MALASTDDLGLAGDGMLDRLAAHSDDGHSVSGGSSSTHRRRSISRLFKGRRRHHKSTAHDDLASFLADVVPPLPDARPQSQPQPQQHSGLQSNESLALHKSVPSSLLTEDSDNEPSSSPAPVRPGISPHQSHAGYLTLSSPLIAIAAQPVESRPAPAASLVESAESAEKDSAPAPQHPNTLAVAQDIKRSVSPVEKLKDAFSPQQRPTSPKTAASTESSRPSTSSGGTLGALFGGKPRIPRILNDTVLQASPPQINSGSGTEPNSRPSPSVPRRTIAHVSVTPLDTGGAPTTLVTPPTPTESTANPKTSAKHTTSQSNPNVVVSPSGNMISHRRVRSATNPPSKLSSSISAPLTPTPEEAKTPGGTVGPAQPPSGFFSSVISAAQNAATSLGTTIANSAAVNKTKIGVQQLIDDKNTGDVGGEEVIGPETVNTVAESTGTEKRRLAVETLGSGNLSLAQLGIIDSSDQSPESSQVHLPRMADDVSAKAEDVAAAQAISAAYAAEQPAPVADDRPRSYTTASGASGTAPAGAVSPSRYPQITESPASVQRQGSIRSKISGSRSRRHRGSSAATGNTIATAIGQSTVALAPSAALNGQRLNGTGFAVASPKRNRDFHNLFKSVPEDDYLIEDYSAALQKEILLQGRLYVSEGHLCFSSNILGWVTNLVISFDEVVSVEKKSTAMLFPNGMVIQTLHARNIFASFLSRDSTYDLIIGIWKISHPNLKSTLNGVTLDGSGTGDKTEKAESVGSDEGSMQDSDDEVYDEDAEEEGMSFTEAGEGSVMGSELGSDRGAEARKATAVIAQAVSGGPSRLSVAAEAVLNGVTTTQDFPGPATHAPTECGDADQHYDKLLIDTTIPAPLGKIYSLMFGPASGVFMRKWLVDDQKSTELVMEDDKKGLGEDRKTYSYSYIKPLFGSVGPKQTRCNISMNLEQFDLDKAVDRKSVVCSSDLDKAVTVLCSTQTPDVPSGSAFLTKTRYCLSWGPANSTRLIMSFTVEWSAKSWLRMPIEKGANDGQLTYATAITSALRTAVTAKAISKPPGRVGKNGKRRNKAQAADGGSTPAPTRESTPSTQVKSKQQSWGLFEPVRATLTDLKVFTGILSILLIWSLFIRSPSQTSSIAQHAYPHSSAQRIAAYEQIWRSEEAELWKWIEARVTLDRVHDATGRKVQMATEMQDKLVEEDLQQRMVDEAIHVTEERLEALKGAVRRERDHEGESGESGSGQ